MISTMSSGFSIDDIDSFRDLRGYWLVQFACWNERGEDQEFREIEDDDRAWLGDVIARLFRRQYSPSEGADARGTRLAKRAEAARGWIAEDGETRVGFVLMVDNRIDLIGVDATAQGRGWGRALVRHALAKLEQRPLVVGTPFDNEGAIKLYRSLKFIPYHFHYHIPGRT